MIIGDTTTGKSETVRKLILLLRAGTLITAETSTVVGLTATAYKSEGGEWVIDYGFLPTNDLGLLAIDGYQKLSKHASSQVAEAERQGAVIKGAAAKGSAPARTRQIKIANAVNKETGKYSTKSISDFFYPIQAVNTVLDKTLISRLDLLAISDSRDVSVDMVCKTQRDNYDEDLELFGEVLRWMWSGYPEVEISDEALLTIQNKAKNLYNKFYSDEIPLVSIDTKFKLTRLSVSLAAMTLSTDEDLKVIRVNKEHVIEISRLLQELYKKAGLHIIAKTNRQEKPSLQDLKDLIHDIREFNISPITTMNILKYFAMEGGATRDVIMEKFNLADNNELRPLLAKLKAEGLIKSGRGYYATPKLIHYARLIEEVERGIHSDLVNLGKIGKN
jgi:hypothetical protein